MATSSGTIDWSSDWSVIVCGDLQKPLVIHVTDPQSCTVAQLKEQIKKEAKLPRESNFCIYCNEEPLSPDEAELTNCKGMKNGVAICISSTESPFIIKVQRVDTGVVLPFELPLIEARQQWSILALRHLILYRFGISLHVPHIIAIQGKIIEDIKEEGQLKSIGEDIKEKGKAIEGDIKEKGKAIQKDIKEEGKTIEGDVKKECELKTIGDYDEIKSGCLLTLTLLSDGYIICRPKGTKSNITLPLETSKTFANEKICHDRLHKEKTKPINIHYSLCNHIWKVGWNITIKKLDGVTETKIKISGPAEPWTISVFQFREVVSEKLSIPTYQQRLAFGDTVMNDWSEHGARLQLLSDYYLHDGATILLEVLPNGIYIKMPAYNPRMVYYDRPYVNYINIPCPGQTTVQQLKRMITTNLRINDKESNNYKKGKISFYPDRCYKRGPFFNEQIKLTNKGDKSPPETLLTTLEWLKKGCQL